MKTLRTKTADKINSFLKTAQAEPEVPEEEDAEDAEDEAEEEKKDEEDAEDEIPEGSLESLSEDVKGLKETLEVVVDALADQKDVLESVLMGETEREEDFEDFADDKEELEEEEYSDDEFGMEENLSATKEGEMTLREKRIARLARAKKATTKKAETMADQFGLDKSLKLKYKPIQPEVPKSKMAPVNIPEMYKGADLALERTKDKKAWTVLDQNDKPLCIIYAGNGVDPVEFASEDYAKKIIMDMKKMGVRKALEKYNAMAIEAMDDDKEKDKKKKKKNEDSDKKSRMEASNYRRRFARAVRLVLTAMGKNLIRPIPLKMAFYEILTEMRIPDSMKIIEAAFARGGQEHFEVALSEIDKYLDMSDEAFVEAEAMVGGSSVSSVPAAPSETAEITEADNTDDAIRREQLAHRASMSSVPFSTYTEADVGDKYAGLADALPKPSLLYSLQNR